MGKGILGPVIERIPLPVGGKTLDVRDGSKVPGVKCEIHGKDPAEVAPVFLELLRRPGGLDACPACTLAVVKAIKARNAALGR